MQNIKWAGWLWLLLGSVAAGQGMAERKQAKLAEAWLQKNPWLTNYDAALAESRTSGRPIFAYFTRSYAP